MYDLLLKIMEEDREQVSFFDRMVTMHEFFVKHDLYKEMWEPQPDVPMSFVWAITTKFPEIFEFQLGSLLQMPGILNKDDELIIVADTKRSADVHAMVGNLREHVDIKIVSVRRELEGDRPTFNWDVGLDYVKHDKVFFLRDLALFFHPWETIAEVRRADVEQGTLYNLSVILGPVWSRFHSRWLYLVHPRFAPSPLLFGFTASADCVKDVGGFDQTFRRGFDHLGELDFLLRWASKGFKYELLDGDHILHPGLSADQDELRIMQLHSAINRRYFFDRYGDELINSLPIPYRLETPLLELNHCKTLEPLSEVVVEGDVDLEELPNKVKDLYTFAKRPNSDFVVEVA